MSLQIYLSYLILLPCGILRGYLLVNAFFIIFESDTVPSQPTKTYVNFRSKVHAASTFIVG